MRIESNKLRQSARGRDCTLRLPGICRRDSETVVLCHLSVGMKGMGMKSPDLFAVFGCDSCHAVIDGRARGEFDQGNLLRALAETQMHWVETGLLVVKGAA